MGEFYGNQHTESKYSDYEYDDLVEDVRTLAEELGEPPTTADADADDRLPYLAKIYELIEEDWSTVLADAGIESRSIQVGEYDSEDRNRMIADLRKANDETPGPTLTMRAYDDCGEFATSTVKKHFGSWKEACEAADIDSGQRHGEQCRGPRGNQLDSRHELAVARCLDELEVQYETHVSVGETLWTCDFYLPEFGLRIEVDGYIAGSRPNEWSFTQKIGYYVFRNLDFAVVETPLDLKEELRDRDVI